MYGVLEMGGAGAVDGRKSTATGVIAHRLHRFERVAHLVLVGFSKCGKTDI